MLLAPVVGSCATRARRWRRASCWPSPSGCWTATSRTGTSSTSTAREPVGAGRRVRGVRLTPRSAERLVGLLQHAGIVFGRLRARCGPGAAASPPPAAVVSLVLIIGPGRAHRHGVERRGGARRLLPGRRDRGRSSAGAERSATDAAGRGRACSPALALLFRPDLVIAMSPRASAPSSGSCRRPAASRLLVGGRRHAVAVPRRTWPDLGHRRRDQGMFIEPVFDLRGGRSLPVPPSWNDFDGFLQRGRRAAHRRLAAADARPSRTRSSCGSGSCRSRIVVASSAAWRLRRRDRGSAASRVLWPPALFGAALLPQALQRPDTAHLAWVSCVTFALMVPAVATLIEASGPAWPDLARRRRWPDPSPRSSSWSSRSSRRAPTSTSSARPSATTGSARRSAATAAPSTTAAPRRAGQAQEVVRHASTREAQPGRAALRRPGRPVAHALQRRVLLLPVPRADARHALHRDGPGHRQRRRLGPGRRGARRPTG